ncbi:hypothetical protein Micbo1qcDRAFT_162395 [Microdochium bolleyi]|uniref:Uncharacterized protein n=1 Tax=Microdochium bolleyi TaxID=196109 RepID=A0A136J5H2_9PEZI|nr:hypothetical protein Micbo1qcDRAFT_162395 [Microdochium bolleyi]
MADESSSNIPYTVGAVFTIRAETPPCVEDAVSGGNPTLESQKPEATRPAPPTAQSRSPPHQLEITGTFKVGQARDAQVVLCRISPATSQTGSRELVAKIWDPVYRREPPDWAIPIPAAEAAMTAYSNETAAYERIAASQCSPPWSCIPKYYGSWSLQCPEAPAPSAGPATRRSRRTKKEQPTFRTIYFVLLEYIEGCSMMSLETFKDGPDYILVERCAEDYRLYIWARVLAIECWLDHIGIEHHDIASRNIIVNPAPGLPFSPDDRFPSALVTLETTEPPVVILIDFDLAEVKPESQRGRPQEHQEPQEDHKPQSPIVAYWSGLHNPFYDWVPDWWNADLPERRKWLLREFGNKDYFKRVPIDKGIDHVHVLSKDDKDQMA